MGGTWQVMCLLLSVVKLSAVSVSREGLTFRQAPIGARPVRRQQTGTCRLHWDSRRVVRGAPLAVALPPRSSRGSSRNHGHCDDRVPVQGASVPVRLGDQRRDCAECRMMRGAQRQWGIDIRSCSSVATGWTDLRRWAASGNSGVESTVCGTCQADNGYSSFRKRTPASTGRRRSHRRSRRDWRLPTLRSALLALRPKRAPCVSRSWTMDKS